MSSRIEQIIDEIENYLDECKPAPFSGNSKVLVEKAEMEELLSELRLRTPEEVKRYQKIIQNRDAILQNAQEQADQIIASAQVKTNELVSEHQIMQQAYEQANEVVSIATTQAQEILDKGTNEANSVRSAAMSYVDGLLADFQELLTRKMEEFRNSQDAFMASVQDCYNIVSQNRADLVPPEQQYASPEMGAEGTDMYGAPGSEDDGLDII